MKFEDLSKLVVLKKKYEDELFALKRARSLSSVSLYFSGYNGINPTDEIIEIIKRHYVHYHHQKCLDALYALNELNVDVKDELEVLNKGE